MSTRSQKDASTEVLTIPQDTLTVYRTFQAWSDSIEEFQAGLGRFGRWQDRDIDSCRICGLNGRSWPWNSPAALHVVHREICKIRKPLRAGNSSRGEDGPSDCDDGLLIATLKDIRETSVLVRALEWIDSASQDVRVARYIQEAASSIHPVIKSSRYFDQSTVRTVSDWCLFTAMQSRGGDGCPPHLVLAAEVPEASITIYEARDRTEGMSVSFMRELLLAVCQQLVI